MGKRKDQATHAQQAQSEWELAQDWVNWLSAGNQPAPLTMHGSRVRSEDEYAVRRR